MASAATDQKREAEMEDLFIYVVKQLARSPYVTAEIPGMLADRGLSRGSIPSAKTSSKSSSTYWYTTAGLYGWKLQRQIMRDSKDASKRQATGVCRILNDKDEAVGYGEELVMRMAILVLVTPDPKFQPATTHTSMPTTTSSTRPAAAPVALPPIRTARLRPAATAPARAEAPMKGTMYSAADAAADMQASQSAPEPPATLAAEVATGWTPSGHPFAAKSFPAGQADFTTYGRALDSATRGRMRSAEVKKCKVESWLVTQAVAPTGVEISGST